MLTFEIVLAALLALAAAAGVALAAGAFNRLVAARNACSNARAGIDVQLVRRHELVPALVSVVRGYAEHERETLAAAARARAAAVAALGTPASAPSEARLGDALVALQARIEAYPELRAGENFLHLQRTLTEVEEQLAAARRAFNAQVRILNDLVGQFPTLLIARLTGFAPQPFFEATEPARSPPAADGAVRD